MQENQDKEQGKDEIQSAREYKKNPFGGEIFRTRPDRPGPYPASYKIRTCSFLGVKRPGHGVDHPHPRLKKE
jgi:hypothetical protein